MTLGEKIRKLRRSHKMTLQNVATETGYSKALISRIENDSVSPSINSLLKITKALGISLYELFAAVEGKDPALVKKKERATGSLAGDAIKVEGLSASQSDNRITAVIMTFEPGAESNGGKLNPHGGEEWWHIIKGKLTAQVGDTAYDLSEGDSLYLKSSIPHGLKNPAKAKTAALVLIAS
jgi:transcriptional regulator with XRE-family HTH domain